MDELSIAIIIPSHQELPDLRRHKGRATISPLLPVKPEVMPPAVLGSGWLAGKTKTDAD